VQTIIRPPLVDDAGVAELGELLPVGAEQRLVPEVDLDLVARIDPDAGVLATFALGGSLVGRRG